MEHAPGRALPKKNYSAVRAPAPVTQDVTTRLAAGTRHAVFLQVAIKYLFVIITSPGVQQLE
jgi:hypothetical protein